MRLKFFIIIMLVLSYNVNAQDKLTGIDANLLSRFISDNIINEKIKDSTAVYTFSLKIEIQKKKGILKVESKLNNPIIYSALNNLEGLSQFNYDAYLENGRAKILMRFYLTVLNSDYGSKLIDIYKIPATVKYFFEKGDDGFIDLGAYGIMIDKKVYN